MEMGPLPWIAFNLFILAMLALDLGVFHRKAHAVGFKEAVCWSIFWVMLSLGFGLGVYLFWPDQMGGYGRGQAALAFLTGYLIEKSLSVDNIFVFLMLFTYFGVPAVYQHKVLFWGILGALVMRACFIFAGVALIEKFSWTIYVFGGLLIVTGIKMVVAHGHEIHPERNPVLRIVRRVLPVAEGHEDGSFFTRVDGRWMATPLLVVLLLVETTDLIFAVDSIPAILGITTNAFIVYTSNVFAILGLRSLYFALAGFMRLFCYLSYGLAAILVFVGCKMLAHAGLGYKVPVGVSLAVVASILIVAVLASLLRARATGRINAAAREDQSVDEPSPTTTSLPVGVRAGARSAQLVCAPDSQMVERASRVI